MWTSRYLASVLVIAGLVGHPASVAAAPGIGSQEESRSLQGKEIYNFRCYFCHGYFGNARTLASSFLNPLPRDFTAPPPLSRERMVASVTHGRPATAMPPFGKLLTRQEIEHVVDFVVEAFMTNPDTPPNGTTPPRHELSGYHTEANGWPDHQQYAKAYPFATGEIPLDRGDDALTREQQAGKRLFMTTCITCHDRGRVENEGPVWEPMAVSYPRGDYSPDRPSSQVDATSGATPYLRHDQPPLLTGLTDQERQGENLFQQNCAFCHGGDGSGKNWIGSFLEPHPRNLTDRTAMNGMTAQRLAMVIREGLPGTSMPAWKAVLNESEIHSVIRYIHRAFHPLPDL